MKPLVAFVLLLAGALLISCSKDDEKDTEKPVIDMIAGDAFPKPCDTLYIGKSFLFSAVFTDNVALGAYNLELHHNFDHHTHGSHNETCPLDPIKEPDSPFYLNQSYEIPDAPQSYTALREIYIPPDVDAGDYHFMVRVTDKEGWQSWRSVSVKIAEGEPCCVQ